MIFILLKKIFFASIILLIIYPSNAYSEYCPGKPKYNVWYPCENYKDEICKNLHDKFLLTGEYEMVEKSCSMPRTNYDYRKKIWGIDEIEILNNLFNFDFQIRVWGEIVSMKEMVENSEGLFGLSVEYHGNKIRFKNYSEIMRRNKDKVADINKLSDALHYKDTKNPLLGNLDSRNFYCNNCNLENIDLKSLSVGFDSINSNFNNSNLSRVKTHLVWLSINGGTIVAEKKDDKYCKNFMEKKYNMACEVYSGVGKSAINLSGSTFLNSNLKGANLRYADLRNTNFTGADLTNVDLRFSDLRNSIFINTKLKNTDFTGAILDDSIFEDNEYILTNFSNTIFQNTNMDGSKFDKLAISLGCNPGKRKKLDKCVKRIMKSEFGVNIDLNGLKQNYIIMQNLQNKIEIINIAKNNNFNPNSSKQEKPPKNYSSANPEWKIDQAGRGYWDYGNGIGWMPNNQYYDEIINGFSLPNWQKEKLLTGSSGPVTIWDSGIVTKW